MVFLGNASWSVPPFEAVRGSHHEIVRVLTRTPRPAGRGNALRPTAVAEWARASGLPMLEIDSIRDRRALRALEEARLDVLVVVAYGEVLPAEILHVPAIAPVNLHFSLLPELRGADPVRAAILDGRTETGVTTMWMDEGLDTGDVLRREPAEIRVADDAGSLGARLAELGGSVLVRTLDALADGSARRVPQDASAASVARKLGPEDRPLRWTDDAAALARRVRALAPEPAATARFHDRSVKVHRAIATEDTGEPGMILAAGHGGIVVAAGSGALRLLEVGPEAKPRMSGAEFARGARMKPGERMA